MRLPWIRRLSASPQIETDKWNQQNQQLRFCGLCKIDSAQAELCRYGYRHLIERRKPDFDSAESNQE